LAKNKLFPEKKEKFFSFPAIGEIFVQHSRNSGCVIRPYTREKATLFFFCGTSNNRNNKSPNNKHNNNLGIYSIIFFRDSYAQNCQQRRRCKYAQVDEEIKQLRKRKIAEKK
jgi:hypothetical protein